MLPKLFFFSILSSLIFTNSYSQCLDHQKSLLLQLKNELVFESSRSTKLVQWNRRDENCCKWYGVECDAAGNVTSLQLDGESISGGIGDLSSLFRLEYLQKLNLAYNDFFDAPIPKGIHNLAYLTHLNLSDAGFSGQVPAEISFLKRLVSLDISNLHWLSLEYPNMEMLLQNMTGLKELYFDSANISSDERSEWSRIISYLPNLTALSLVNCGLSGPFAKSFWQLHSLSILRLDGNYLLTVPDLFANFSSLTSLSLSGNSLKGSFPNRIFQIPTLHYLDLSGNKELSGSIPPFTQTGSLKSIRLRETNFTGLIPTSISNLKTLEEIDLYHCQFTGSIPLTFANLTRLVRADLSYNFFTGSLPPLYGGLPNLVFFNLEYNSFSGNIPQSIFGLPSLLRLQLNNNQFTGLDDEFPIVNVSNILYLDLSYNRLEGPIPESFFQLQSLKSLNLMGNLFNGTFQLEKIQSLPNLTGLYLSYNNLSVDVGNDKSSTYRLPSLTDLGLASCNLYDFPDFIQHSDVIRNLDLSNNGIGGEIPSWIWRTPLESLNLSLNLLAHLQKPYSIPSSLQTLDLHSNQIRGELHLLIPSNITSQLWFISIRNNSFSGSFPTLLCEASDLEFIDLSINKLSGSMPPCLPENIKVLDLGRNNISGPIPDKFSIDCFLEYLDLNNNTLEGKIPESLGICTSLEFMNIGNNNIDDTFPCILSSTLRVLVLRSNRFHGEVACHKSWQNLQILDISSNHFNGSLKSMNFSSWRAMVPDNDTQLRYNHSASKFLRESSIYSAGVRITIKGHEVELVKIWPDFTAVDLSFNNFHGEIPHTIANLSLLRLLNLSHNVLNGSIPQSFGRFRELESLDLSQNQLTGPIPMELAGLTFLSFLNLSYNKLVGEIPNGRQLQTFSADSFKGNKGLCGFNLNISCSNTTDSDLSSPEPENVQSKREIEWEYVSAALGYVVGLGSIVWLLLFCRSFRQKYFGKIDEVVEEIFDARDRRRRRRARRRLVRNRVRRQ